MFCFGVVNYGFGSPPQLVYIFRKSQKNHFCPKGGLKGCAKSSPPCFQQIHTCRKRTSLPLILPSTFTLVSVLLFLANACLPLPILLPQYVHTHLFHLPGHIHSCCSSPHQPCPLFTHYHTSLTLNGGHSFLPQRRGYTNFSICEYYISAPGHKICQISILQLSHWPCTNGH